MRKKDKTNKLYKKLLIAFVGALIAIVMSVTLIGSMVLFSFNEQTKIRVMYVSQVLILILLIFAFAYIVEKIVVCRIRNLNNAMKEVAKGDYEIAVPVDNKDEISELSDSFNKMTSELKSNAFLSRDFTRYVSHEFKTPLAVIRSHAEAAQYAQTPAEANEYLDIIIAETDRLASISKNIMELCRLDSTTLISKDHIFSPAAQIRAILLSTQFSWGEKNIVVDPELEEFEIQSNETLVFRIWENLIGNAIKFTSENGNIAIVLKKNDNELFFSISDDGIGIADEDKGQIYDPFFTGDRSHNKEGSGLGLPLTKTIVGKLNGKIAFESKLGKGTTFTVTLPI